MKPIITVPLKPVSDTLSVFEFLVPEDLPVFAGHFPERPIVPGFLILNWVYDAIREMGFGFKKALKVRRLKFHNILLPKESCRVSLSFSEEKNRYEFTVLRLSDELKIASGFILPSLN